MNKEDFLRNLNSSLSGFTEEERKDILYDYEEHFRLGIESGKTEEALIAELGDPESIANQYKTNLNFEKAAINEANENMNNNMNTSYNKNKTTAEDVSISIIAAIGLLLFNLIFILGPYLGLLGALIGLFAGAVGAFLGGAFMTFGTMLLPFTNNFFGVPFNVSPSAAFLFGVGTIAFGALFFIGDCYIAKYFFKGTSKYLNWNMRIIKRM
ncbi:DUF1700 domain-containing protein [Clostridium sp. YIM B02515]|uniref:DUF1700 domain-containing protein n=1 Tax=Clostridium rhizosphaerae TaxID=2803861 RepID=A0ABS1TDF4_9CLOT|nr:DUF1700 domain-containing protein [Clostridium rhizosphaerae]MBL4937396.1 DUF1700 domain-containing protein [Clostridium rhizosphaerae]